MEEDQTITYIIENHSKLTTEEHIKILEMIVTSKGDNSKAVVGEKKSTMVDIKLLDEDTRTTIKNMMKTFLASHK